MHVNLYPLSLTVEYFKNEILFLSNIWQGIRFVCSITHVLVNRIAPEFYSTCIHAIGTYSLSFMKIDGDTELLRHLEHRFPLYRELPEGDQASSRNTKQFVIYSNANKFDVLYIVRKVFTWAI